MFTWKRNWSINPLILYDREISLSVSVKYLGIILDSKLNWKPHIEEACRKARVLLFACQRAMGKSWGLAPVLARWIFVAMVRPIMSYASVVWCNAIDRFGYNVDSLNKIQHLACRFITGGLKSAPTKALEICSDLSPLPLFIKQTAVSTAVRLMDWKKWIHQPVRGRGTFFNHSIFISNLMKGKIDFSIPRDRIGSSLSPFKPFKSLILPREEALCLDSIVGSSSIRIYTDGSKTGNGSGAGYIIYIPVHPFTISDSIPLNSEATVFQAEIRAVKQAADCLYSYPNLISHDIFFFSDSIVAIKALDCTTIKSQSVADCLVSLGRLASHGKEIRIAWVPGHSGVWGNEIADALAVAASNSRSTDRVTLPLAPSVIQGKISKFFRQCHEKEWKESNSCRLTRPILTDMLLNHTNCLVTNRRLTRWLTYILSGHAPVTEFLHKIGKLSSPVCRFCGQGSETIEHFICNCIFFSYQRLIYLGNTHLSPAKWLEEFRKDNLIAYLKSTNRFDRGIYSSRPPDD